MVQVDVLARTLYLIYGILLNEASLLLFQLLQTQSYYYLHERLIKLRASFNKTNRHLFPKNFGDTVTWTL